MSGRTLKRVWWYSLLFSLGPGTIMNWFLRDALWWTNLMSLLAIQLTLGTLWAAARTETKQDKAMSDGDG